MYTANVIFSISYTQSTAVPLSIAIVLVGLFFLVLLCHFYQRLGLKFDRCSYEAIEDAQVPEFFESEWMLVKKYQLAA